MRTSAFSFEAVARFDAEEKKALRFELDGLILRHEARSSRIILHAINPFGLSSTRRILVVRLEPILIPNQIRDFGRCR
jgi:hypothetical protein